MTLQTETDAALDRAAEDRLVADGSGLVYLGADVLVLPPKERAVLHMLLLRSPQVVTKDEFASHVWTGGDMSDESLVRCIYGLRRRLRRAGQRVWIETAYGSGYRLLRPCGPVPPP